MQIKAKSAVCQKKNAKKNAKFGLVTTTSQTKNRKFFTIFLCYFIIKFTSENCLCKKSTVKILNIKIDAELNIWFNIFGVEKFPKGTPYRTSFCWDS